MLVNKENISFLLYSCLSVSVDALNNKDASCVLDAAIKRAFRDASSHVLSIENNDPRNSKSEKTNPDMIIAKAVCDLKDSDDYDTWHCNLCNRLCEAYSKCTYKKANNRGELSFSFGIAQKWVNMTMKYLTLLSDVCSNSELEESDFYMNIGKKLSSFRNFLHAPVDRFIINAAWNCPQISLPLKEDVDNGKRIKKYKNPSDYVEAWSKWNCVDYCQFQNSLRVVLQNEHPGKNVLAWESEAWLVEAERQKTNNKGQNA